MLRRRFERRSESVGPDESVVQCGWKDRNVNETMNCKMLRPSSDEVCPVIIDPFDMHESVGIGVKSDRPA